jgi:sirohydrochlorin cobaltochelatase
MPNTEPPCRVVLLAHGSGDPRWRRPFEELLAGLQADLGRHAIALAYLEISPPSLLDAAAEASSQAIACLRILPLFMAGGEDLDRRIAGQVREIAVRFPDLRLEVLPPIGQDPRMISLLRQSVRETSRGPLRRGPEGRP